MGRAKRRTAGFLVGALVLTGAACSDEPTKPSELSDEPSTSSVPSSSANSEEQAVINQYKGFFTALNDEPDLSEATVAETLTKFATGDALAGLSAAAANWRAANQRLSGSVQFSTISVEFTPTMAIARECRDTSSELVVDATTGNVVSTGVPGTAIEAHLIQEDGVWKVSAYGWEEGKC